MAVREVRPGAMLHEHDLRPPFLVLGQSQSENITPGMFKRGDTDEEYSELEVIPLFVQATRLQWPPGEFSRDSKPTCFSYDAKVGAPGGEYEGQQCRGCEFYVKVPWAVPGDNVQPCMPGYAVLLLDAMSFEPFILQLRGTSAGLGKQLGGGGVFRRAVLRLFATQVTTAKGIFYVVKAKTLRPLDEADRDLVMAQVEDYSEVNIGAPAENVAGEVVTVELRDTPEMRYTPSGDAVTAVTIGVPGGDSLGRMYAWRDLAEDLNGLAQGTVVDVRGTWKTREWQDHAGADQSREEFTITAILPPATETQTITSEEVGQMPEGVVDGVVIPKTTEQLKTQLAQDAAETAANTPVLPEQPPLGESKAVTREQARAASPPVSETPAAATTPLWDPNAIPADDLPF